MADFIFLGVKEIYIYIFFIFKEGILIPPFFESILKGLAQRPQGQLFHILTVLTAEHRLVKP